MFENIPPQEDKKTPEEIKAYFVEQENMVIAEAVEVLDGAEPEKYKKKGANLLLALSLFVGASSAFASEKTDQENLPALDGEQSVQVLYKKDAKNQIAGFDWSNIVKKIEISAGGKKEEIKDFTPEDVAPYWFGDMTRDVSESQSDFYKGATGENFSHAYTATSNAVYNSKNTDEFFARLHGSSEKGGGFTEQQKGLVLQEISRLLNYTYNEDMLSSDTRVGVSDEKMFSALKDAYSREQYSTTKAGICGNIATFLAKTAESMGVEAWLQSGSTESIGHVWTGAVLKGGEEKQIVFFDAGSLFPTGTLNYKDALGVMEKHYKKVSTLNSFVGNTHEILFPVGSRAQEVAQHASGLENVVDKLSHNMEHGEIQNETNVLEVAMSPEAKEIKLTADHIGVVFTDFKNSSHNPYQSLESLSSLGVTANVQSAKLGFETGATVLHMNVNDFYGGSVASNEVIVKIAGDYIDKKQLTKNEYGEFLVNFGASLESAFKLPPGLKNLKEGKGEGALGARIVYVNPERTGEFYVEASDVFRGQSNDFENQKIRLKKVEENITFGGAVNVFEGAVVKAETGKSTLDWGKSAHTKVEFAGDILGAKIGYEKKISDYERFIPSAEKVEAEISYKGGPQWEVSFVGSKTTEKYKDAESRDVKSAEVKLKVYLW